jgi:putative phosphoribosyl transferase
MQLPQALFGSSSGGAASLLAAANPGARFSCVVCRGANLESITNAVPLVSAPTLLIAGGHDTLIVCLNENAFAELRCEKQLKLVPGATHLFDECGALDKVAQLAADWFLRHMTPPRRKASGSSALSRFNALAGFLM